MNNYFAREPSLCFTNDYLSIICITFSFDISFLLCILLQFLTLSSLLHFKSKQNPVRRSKPKKMEEENTRVLILLLTCLFRHACTLVLFRSKMQITHHWQSPQVHYFVGLPHVLSLHLQYSWNAHVYPRTPDGHEMEEGILYVQHLLSPTPNHSK